MKSLFIAACLFVPVVALAQWTSSGDNYTTGRLAVGTSTYQKTFTVVANASGDHSAYIANDHASGYGLYIRSVNTPLRIASMSGGEDPFIVAGGGKVGVNINSPAHTFQVNSAAATIPVIAIGKAYQDTNGSSQLIFYSGSNSGAYANGFTVDYKKTSSTDRLAFVDGGNVEVISLLNGGKVGIGTTNPGSFKLAVEGKIGAREINVTTTSPFPDYVFESDYKLPSLESVKQFIADHKHLPEVPSAKEVGAKGIDVGEMNTILLKKVEELTLYVIQLKTELDEVKAKVK